MKTQKFSTPLALQLPVILFTFLTLNVPAATRYVDANNPSPAPPYTSWATAAQVIQVAVDAAALLLLLLALRSDGAAVQGRAHHSSPRQSPGHNLWPDRVRGCDASDSEVTASSENQTGNANKQRRAPAGLAGRKAATQANQPEERKQT